MSAYEGDGKYAYRVMRMDRAGKGANIRYKCGYFKSDIPEITVESLLRVTGLNRWFLFMRTSNVRKAVSIVQAHLIKERSRKVKKTVYHALFRVAAMFPSFLDRFLACLHLCHSPKSQIDLLNWRGYLTYLTPAKTPYAYEL